MSLVNTPPPLFSKEEITQLIRDNYNLNITIRPLVSDIGQNFHIIDHSGKEFVFKIANPEENKDMVDMQNRTMGHIALNNKSIKAPRVCKTKQGEEIVQIKHENDLSYYARMLTFLPGTFLADIKNHLPDLLYDFGMMLGSMDKTLEDFYHPAAYRYWHWDLKNALDLLPLTKKIIEPRNRSIAEYFFLQFECMVLPQLPKLRKSVIHNDANDHNILIKGKEGKEFEISGIIDFGDMVHTNTICELAIACAYIMLGKDDPLDSVLDVVRGYNETYPLQEEEIEVLFYLICTRLCSSVTIAAYQRELQEDNEYLSVSEQPAWNILHKLISINPVQALEAFRKECRFEVINDQMKVKNKVRKERKIYIGKSLSISYKNPLKIDRGAMQYLFDDQGKTYLDCVNNVCHVGHCHPRIVRAAQKQAALLNTNTRYLHENIIEYAKQLNATMPDPLNVCYFVNSGSEANELAIRLANTYTQQKDFIVIDNAYHGNTSSVINLSPYKFDGPGGPGNPPHIHKVTMPDVYRGSFKSDDTNAAKKYASDVEQAINKINQNRKGLSAFIFESILGCGGQIVFPSGYLKESFRFVKEVGGLCIADEVQVGFGRVGTHFWGFETQDVIPDIVTLGKPIGNGHPLAAVVTTKEIADAFDNGMEYFNTFGGNPVSCAIGLAVLDVMNEENLQKNALNVGNLLKEGFEELKTKHDLIGDIRGMGLFIGIELVLDRKSLEPAKDQAYYIIERMKELGILLSIDGPLYNVIKIKPPIVFSESNAKFLIENLDEVLKEKRSQPA
ncbi:MAG: aminotransferase class III-fold pyridoxal phosphate-dependent enzyme [Ignavibacteria bacterium]|nr:aminotransferase class III-fold pyridoxal phosphate-dependent enzyme [Ignavibacteria bacterium]MBT8381750.1 aminotransferase class III-fold pyridoxal phosphate-dependent enzyme [Ignavibacteria bacterium]NNJ53990.1 aminotransferase class III-fold pyridoxal phosphate-dependent enzyme [Ignavibacteriaceae bacterium]NNL21575.1 aminotransferase class III-fold pyridoxal phosphate-dependent enzyme [Ignavibacteriaceae bacterium]